jgi:hypothetical protein
VIILSVLYVQDEELLEQEAGGVPAPKMDENMWKNREQMEEILFLLDKSHRPIAVSLALDLAVKMNSSFQF